MMPAPRMTVSWFGGEIVVAVVVIVRGGLLRRMRLGSWVRRARIQGGSGGSMMREDHQQQPHGARTERTPKGSLTRVECFVMLKEGDVG